MTYFLLYLISISEGVRILFLGVTLFLVVFVTVRLALYIDGYSSEKPVLLIVLTIASGLIMALIPSEEGWNKIINETTICEAVNNNEIKDGGDDLNLKELKGSKGD